MAGSFKPLHPSPAPLKGVLGHPFGTRLGSARPLAPLFLSPCRDVALSIAALSFNLWFTKLSCKDVRLVSASAEAPGVLAVAGFLGSLSSPPPDPGDLGAAALHAQQVGDAGGAGAGEQRAEGVSKGIAGAWRGDELGLGHWGLLPSRAWSRGVHGCPCWVGAGAPSTPQHKGHEEQRPPVAWRPADIAHPWKGSAFSCWPLGWSQLCHTGRSGWRVPVRLRGWRPHLLEVAVPCSHG